MCTKAGTGRLAKKYTKYTKNKMYTKYTKTKMYTLRFMSSKIRFKYLFCSPYQNYCDLPNIIVSGGHLQSPPQESCGPVVGQTGKARIYTPKALNLGSDSTTVPTSEDHTS